LWLGVALGLAGASFAVALPQSGRWYPPHMQGVVLGLAGAGNIGVVIDTSRLHASPRSGAGKRSSAPR
jgi:NNP family nitrate/nitrite transporter-like MFS transporter